MPYTVVIEPQDPTWTEAAQRVRCWLDRAGRYQVVSVPLIILVLLERRHSGAKENGFPLFVGTRFAVGNTKQLTK